MAKGYPAISSEQKPELSINLPPSPKWKKILAGLPIGKSVTVEVSGIVTSLGSESYGSSLRLQIKGLAIEPSMGAQMDRVKASRTVGKIDENDAEDEDE